MGFQAWRSLSVLFLAGIALTGCRTTQRDQAPVYPKAAGPQQFPNAGQQQFPIAGQQQFPTAPNNLNPMSAQPKTSGSPFTPASSPGLTTPTGAPKAPSFQPMGAGASNNAAQPWPHPDTNNTPARNPGTPSTPTIPSVPPGGFAGSRDTTPNPAFPGSGGPDIQMPSTFPQR